MRRYLSAANRRVAAAAVVVAAVAVVASPAFGVGHRFVTLFGDGSSAGPSIDSSNALPLTSATTSSGMSAALWSAPRQGGGTCMFVVAPSYAASASPPTPTGGAICNESPSSQPAPIQTFVDWITNAGTVNVVVYGHVASTSGITQLGLSSKAGTMKLPLNDGYFMVALPAADVAGKLPPGGPFQVIGDDSSGTPVSTVDLQQLLMKSEPS